MLSVDFGRAAADFFGHGFDPSGLGVVDINQATKGNCGDPDPLSHNQKLYSKTGFPVHRWSRASLGHRGGGTVTAQKRQPSRHEVVSVDPLGVERLGTYRATYRKRDFAGTSDGLVDRSALIDSDFSRSRRDRHKPGSSQAGLLAMSIVYLYPSGYGPSKWCPRIASREFA
jgi:hypothetical protein